MQKKLLGLAVLPFLSMSASANETSWMELDQDIANLATTTTTVGDGPVLSGFIKNYYNNDSDADLGGWKFDAVRVNVKGDVDQFSYKVSFDMKDGFKLKDAYVRWSYDNGISATWGMFKRPFLHSFATSSSKRLFIGSTANAANEARDNGAMVNGGLGDMGEWFIAATNGTDDDGDELRLTARAAFDVVGEGGFNAYEGARGDADGTNVSVALAFADDGAAEFDRTALEVAGNMDALSFAIDYVMTSDDAGAPADDTLGTDTADTSALGLTLSYLLAEDMEVAVRHEDFDDADESTRLTLGLNYYALGMNSAVWQFNYADTTSDDDALESEVISLGLVFSF